MHDTGPPTTHRFVKNPVAQHVFTTHMRVLLKDRTLCVREMTAYANSADKHGFRAQITKALTLEAEEDDHPTAGHTIPDSIKVSDRTVLRWMHLCKACYGRHVKGFSDRRGDGDIVAELKQYRTPRRPPPPNWTGPAPPHTAHLQGPVQFRAGVLQRVVHRPPTSGPDRSVQRAHVQGPGCP